MRDENRYSAGSIALAFLLGGAVGAGLAMLLTPRSGPETREIIKERAYSVKGQATRVADEVKTKAHDWIDHSKEMLEQKKAVLESALEAGKDAMERERDRLKARLSREEKEEA